MHPDDESLAAQVDELRRKWLGNRDTAHLSLIEAADLVIGGLHDEIALYAAGRCLPRDHEIREAVSALVDVAHEFHEAQQLRARIQGIVLPLVNGARNAWQLSENASAEDSLTDRLRRRKNP
jgi:hypothetical protein